MFLRSASSYAQTLSPELGHRPRVQSQRLISMALSSTSSFPASCTLLTNNSFAKRSFSSPILMEDEEEQKQKGSLMLSWEGPGEGGVGKNGGNRAGNEGSAGGDGDNNKSINEYYQKMITSYPDDPLILSNYARFLKEVEGDEVKAEGYCERAILAKASDGNVLTLYADLLWRKDKNGARAKPFFDLAVSSSPDDCYVLGSYAKFLWEGGDDEASNDPTGYSSPLAAMAG